ncbi:MAG: baseplate J/gp47 family protein [Oscillospiraceae bacterium]|nr:baseplate J/gp47 family protein [Oscillospiraceae bacterium]
MNIPVLDNRSLDDVRAEVAYLARSYTPEWRCESPEDDPGAAISELFSTMFHETIDRRNALPEKLYLEFLNMIGYREPGPAPARGTMRFSPHDAAEDPVTVPGGTRVFTSDDAGENVVYETARTIQATAARLLDVYFANGEADSIRRLDLSRPQRFFTDGEGEELQRHGFAIGQSDVLRLDCPAVITLELRQTARYLEDETAPKLVDAGLGWYYLHGGELTPFDTAKAERGRILLEKRNSHSMDADEEGHICLYCRGTPGLNLTLEHIALSSAPSEDCPAARLFNGDVALDLEEGGYCFGRRPSPYEMLYLRSDTALSKKGALAMLRMDLAFVVDAPKREGQEYQYGMAIIDRSGAVEAKPDDVFISGVVWEYYNGVGWRNLPVSGDRNPFSGRKEGALELTFRIPEDLAETEVNAEAGLYIRARVTEVENQFSPLPKWIVPLVRGAVFRWQYDNEHPPKADWVSAENNGETVRIEDAGRASQLNLEVLRMMEAEERAMYLRFDRSPHALPLSLGFRLEGRSRIGEKLIWETDTPSGFAPVQCIDQTENLSQSGEVFLYLAAPLPEKRLYGETGFWLRLRLSARHPGMPPCVREIITNTVPAVQYQREPAQFFSTGVYEVGKTLQLLSTPVQDCRIWVDESARLSEEDARALAAGLPQRVRLEESDHRVRRCWVLWEDVKDLALAGPEDRAYALDPWQGTIRFGDNRNGRVPPNGDRNIRVEYASGGGERGNVPAGAVNALLGGLPRINEVRNITPMSGGTGRLSLRQIEARGNARLRHRGRAAGCQDYEDIVRERFPQVRHVRCFSGLDEKGRKRSGNVTVVIDGYGEQSEVMDSLCRQVYEALSELCSCCLVSEGRLHVCSATRLTVNTVVSVSLEEMERAADIQQEISARLEGLIRDVWKRRPIGEQLRLSELWNTVRETEGVRTVQRIQAEGVSDSEDRRLIPLEKDSDLPYTVVESGIHLVQLVY